MEEGVASINFRGVGYFIWQTDIEGDFTFSMVRAQNKCIEPDNLTLNLRLLKCLILSLKRV